VCFDEKLYERTVEAKGGLIREHLSPSLLFFTAPFSCVITARSLFGTSLLRCLLQARLATFPSMSFRTTKMQHKSTFLCFHHHNKCCSTSCGKTTQKQTLQPLCFNFFFFYACTSTKRHGSSSSLFGSSTTQQTN
jgi:hypothetical protein